MPTRNDLFRKILWFEKKLRFDSDTGFFEIMKPARSVSSNHRYRSGLFHSEKCGREVQYESGCELEFIRFLETHASVLYYWEQPKAIPYWRGKIKAKTYPDFAVYLRSRQLILVEIKPLAEMLCHRVQAKSEGVMEFCCRAGIGFLLTDGRHTPADLLRGTVSRKLEKELSEVLETGPIRKSQWLEIKSRTQATDSQLYRAIIRLDLKFASFPFKLQRGTQSPVFRKVYFEKKRYEDLFMENICSMFGKK